MNYQMKTILARFAHHLVLTLERPDSSGRSFLEYFVEPHLETPDGVFVPASSVFDHISRIILLGGAGTGKTMLLRFKAWQAAHAFLEGGNQGRCPLLMAARGLHGLSQAHSLESIVFASLAVESDIGLTQELFVSMLEQGNLELLVDGLDEVAPEDSLGITQRFSDMFRRYPNTPAIVSSRPAALSISFPGFYVYSLPGFDQSQLRTLIDRLAKHVPEAGERFYDTILESRQLSDLAKTPLLVNLLWSVFESRGTIPTNPVFLYSDFTDYLLSTWERNKGLGQRGTVTLQEKRAILENVALQLVERSQVYFDLRTIDAALDSVVPHVVVRREEIVNELLSSGLLCGDSTGFSFVHKSFVEYFAARAVGARPQEAIRLLDQQGSDEILFFACGLMDDVAPLIEAAIQKRRVVLAAKCISQGRTRNNELKNYVVREFTREVGQPFVDLLSRSVGARIAQDAHTRKSIDLLHLFDSACDPRLANHERGARFEDFAEGFFGEVFKVVSRDLHTENGELDVIVEITRGDPFWIEFGGDALVECKNWTSNIPLKEVGAFLNKVNQGRVKLAFYMSVSGFTEDALRTLRNHAANIAAPLVVPLTGEAIKNALMAGVILEEYFKEEIRAMKYLRKY